MRFTSKEKNYNHNDTTTTSTTTTATITTLLSKAISFAKNYTTISDKDIDIIMHRRKSLLFDNETAWTEKNHNSMFDVSLSDFSSLTTSARNTAKTT